MKNIKIGTRGSRLAIKQAEIVKEALEALNIDINGEIVIIQTKGDRILNRTLDKIGGKGVFVKEIEEALLNKEIDMAVHSLKDMPDEMPEGLEIGAVLGRENPMDALLTNSGCGFYDLPIGARLGTGSLRRKVQIQAIRPDIEVVPIRGNVDSRIRKMEEGNIDGLVLAAAGLIRSGHAKRITHYFTIGEMIPACCQGLLSVEIRKSDENLWEVLQLVHNFKGDVSQQAERSFLKCIGADCHAPAGALAVENKGIINMTAMFYDNGFFRAEGQAEAENAKGLGYRLASDILLQMKGNC